MHGEVENGEISQRLDVREAFLLPWSKPVNGSGCPVRQVSPCGRMCHRVWRMCACAIKRTEGRISLPGPKGGSLTVRSGHYSPALPLRDSTPPTAFRPSRHFLNPSQSLLDPLKKLSHLIPDYSHPRTKFHIAGSTSGSHIRQN